MSIILRNQTENGPCFASRGGVVGDNTPRDAADWVNAARKQAERILADAEQEAAAIRQQAWQQGLADAQAAIDEQVETRTNERITTVQSLTSDAIAQMRHSHEQWLGRWEGHVVRLAMAIAGHVLRRNIEEAPATCVRLAREALELAVGARHLRMFVHPQDLAEVEELLRQATSRLGDAITSEIVPDPRVGRGGCRVETEYGEIDQSWESQLARIEEELI
ncbi:MAG: FliH/SctL family protein [Pirellulaceae bacterium]|nr:hypothetical protein [Planctomycetales bacterium]